MIEATQRLTGRGIDRVYVDKGYRGHGLTGAAQVYISGQKRGVHCQIKRELRRRSAIEPVIGHAKSDGHLGRCNLRGRHGDAANAILSGAGHHFRLILTWLSVLLPLILDVLRQTFSGPSVRQIAS